MSLVNKNYSNSSGTISRSFRIGKNRLTIDNEIDGSLRLSFRDSTGNLTTWKMDSDDNSIVFPDESKIVVDRDTREVMLISGDKVVPLGVNSLKGATQEEDGLLLATDKVKYDRSYDHSNSKENPHEITPEKINAEPAFTKKTAFNKDFGNQQGTVTEGNDPRLSDARTPLAHTHEANDINLNGMTVIGKKTTGAGKSEQINMTELRTMMGIGSDEVASEPWVEEFFVGKTNIADDLVTDDATKVLSARQGKILKDENVVVENKLNNVENTIISFENGALTVKKAERDSGGNIITETYETKTESTNKLLTKVDKETRVAGIPLNGDITVAQLIAAIGEVTEEKIGLMSPEDKSLVDQLRNLLATDDVDQLVNTLGEILSLFENYPEGADLVTALNGKVDKVAGKQLSTNDLTNVLKNYYDTAYAHSQIKDKSNPHNTSFANITDKPITRDGFGITDVPLKTDVYTKNETYSKSEVYNKNEVYNKTETYNKEYIDALKDQNGWKSQLLTLTPLTPSQTIATATLLLYNTLKLQVKNTSTSFVDTDSVEVTIGVVTGNKIQLSDTSVYLEIGATNSTFVAPAGWQLQIVGLKYTELKAEDVSFGTSNVKLELEKKANRYIDEPIAELNNHTLREVFEGGNLIVNGDFSNGNTGWSSSVSTSSVSNNNLVNTANGLGRFPQIIQNNVSITSGHEFYKKIRFRVLNSAEFIYFTTTNPSDNLTVTNPVTNQYYDISKKVTSNNNTTSISIVHQYVDNATASGKQMEIDYVYFISQTTLGISSLTVAQMDYWFNVWQQYKDDNGLKSTVDTLRALKEKDSEIELKVTTIEEAYRKSQNGELTATKSGTDIISLGKDVAPAPLQVKVDGGLIPALNNLVTNGGNPYTVTTGYDVGSIVDGDLVYTTATNPVTIRYSSSVPVANNSVFYTVTRMRTTTESVASISLALQATTSGSTKSLGIQNTPVQNQWYILKGATIPTDHVGNIQMRYYSVKEGGSTLQIDYTMLFNLTALYGVTATSGTAYDNAVADIEAILALKGGYISSTPIHAVGMNKRVRSVGKNLFDKDSVENVIGYEMDQLGRVTVQPNWFTTSFIPAKPNTTYSRTNFGLAVTFYDINKNFISGFANLNNTFTTPLGTCYIRLNALISSKDICQLELGSTATTYAPYVSSDLYLQANKVGYRRYDGILDYINYRNGKYYFNQFLSRVNNIDTPVKELNNKTLRQVFEGGNLVVNGDFSNGTTGWSATQATQSVSSGILSNTGDGTGSIPRTVSNTSLVISNTYYFKYKVRVTNSLSSRIILVSNDGSAILEQNSPVQNTWYELSTKHQPIANRTNIQIWHQYVDSSTANGKVMEIDYVYTINQTALGISSLTVTQMDYWFNEYIKLVASTPTMSLDKLATPIETEILALGNAQGLSGGTVYIDDVMADSNLYTSKYDIENTAYPIKSLDRIVKINADGSQTELAVSSAIIAGDGLSFTHPSLVANDIVWISYYYNVANLFKSNTFVTYNDSPFVQEAWITPTLLNGWVNYGVSQSDCKYMKDTMGFVHLSGLIKNGTDNVIFTLPVGYRPEKLCFFATSSGDAFANITIGASGTVSLNVGSKASLTLDGITFKGV